jgi:PD-(D/E)XK nuclease superfamily protein
LKQASVQDEADLLRAVAAGFHQPTQPAATASDTPAVSTNNWNDTKHRQTSLAVERTTYAVIGAAIEVHRHLGAGYTEIIYERALVSELRLRGLEFPGAFVPACDQSRPRPLDQLPCPVARTGATPSDPLTLLDAAW